MIELGPVGTALVGRAWDAIVDFAFREGRAPTELRISPVTWRVLVYQEHVPLEHLTCFGMPLVPHDDVDAGVVVAYAPSRPEPKGIFG